MFGGRRANVSIQPDGSLLTSVPPGIPGSTVPVALTSNLSELVPSSATFSYTIAEMDVEGPLTYNGEDGDSVWFNGRGRHFYFNGPATLAFATLSPVFHITGTFLHK